MTGDTLPRGAPLLASGYRVVRAMATRRCGRLYEVVADRDGSVHVAREIVPPDSMAPAEVQARSQALAREVLRIRDRPVPGAVQVEDHFTWGARQFVVMERVEGFTLPTVIGHRDAPVPPAVLREWAVSLAVTLQGLASQGRWTAVAAVSPEHVRVTPADEVVLANPGLARLFLDGPEADLREGLRAYAEVVLFMGGCALEDLPPDLSWVMARCLSPDPTRLYRGFAEVAAALRPAVAPEPVVATAEAPVAVPPADLVEVRSRLWTALATAGLLVLLTSVSAVALSAWQQRPLTPVASVVWVASGRDLVGVSTASRAILGRIPLEGEAAGLVSPTARRVLVALRGDRRLLVVDPVGRRTVERVAMPGPASELHTDADGRFLLVVHPEQRVVAVMAIQGDVPRPLGLISAEAPDFAVAALDGRAVAVASLQAGRISVYDLSPLALRASVAVGRPGVMAGGASLRVSLPGQALVELAPASLRERARVSLPEAPRLLRAEPGSTHLWWVGGEGALFVTRGGASSLVLPAGVLSFGFSGRGAGRTVWAALDSGDLVAVHAASGRVLDRIPLGGPLGALTVAEDVSVRPPSSSSGGPSGPAPPGTSARGSRT